MWQTLLHELKQGNYKSLARSISLVENEVSGYEEFLQSLPASHTPVIGITGPPGAGKSTMVDSLIGLLTEAGKKVAVLCVDPSSPFNLGALLGDRIRMSNWYNHPNVFIRSLATRGSLGGLHPKIMEITDVCTNAGFDYVIVETVGVGQSEIEVSGLADITVVVLVPEAGDEVQTMKAGLMEIADIFAVNKADRPDADLFVRNLRLMLAPAYATTHREIPVVKTIATQKQGTKDLWLAIDDLIHQHHTNERKSWLLAERGYFLIQQQRMKDIQKKELKKLIEQKISEGNFNLYRFVKQFNKD
ncbi:MAG: methylmalonyl Co-A mutase-associated GTPase MeaB [Lacibacter sp.]